MFWGIFIDVALLLLSSSGKYKGWLFFLLPSVLDIINTYR